MKDYSTNWIKDEFLTYLFIYCINADYKESKKEIALVKTKTSYAFFDKMHDEFELDSDYASLQKIIGAHNRLGYSSENTEELFNSIKELFLTDGKYDIEERNLLMYLKHLLK
ncbi:hypothetical protein L3X37_07835 [Sabulilitoribacter arenilitoris]|uniref:Uncharacterized protein n=1 Tax=Wocania arenilitoris TaxID=2044858 RepID=A0AAE3ENW2_9FLAO|nr:hypothetical protein [Wocania arenilitoris]MCF7568272.1 hypothetical protein [Wocania arenilitoris]